jgi:hypothetical protein
VYSLYAEAFNLVGAWMMRGEGGQIGDGAGSPSSSEKTPHLEATKQKWLITMQRIGPNVNHKTPPHPHNAHSFNGTRAHGPLSPAKTNPPTLSLPNSAYAMHLPMQPSRYSLIISGGGEHTPPTGETTGNFVGGRGCMVG